MQAVALITAEAYCLCYVQALVHELGHYAVARCAHVDVSHVRIGAGALSAHFGVFSFSPILSGGEVEVPSESLLAKSRSCVVCFFAAGACANLLCSAALLPFSGSLAVSVGIFAGLLMAAYSCLPFIPGTDASALLRTLKAWQLHGDGVRRGEGP